MSCMGQVSPLMITSHWIWSACMCDIMYSGVCSIQNRQALFKTEYGCGSQCVYCGFTAIDKITIIRCTFWHQVYTQSGFYTNICKILLHSLTFCQKFVILLSRPVSHNIWSALQIIKACMLSDEHTNAYLLAGKFSEHCICQKSINWWG